MFCVECGQEGKIYDHLCQECFLKKNQPASVPVTVDVQVCSHCGAVNHGKSWAEEGELDDVVCKGVLSATTIDDRFDLLDPEMGLDWIDERNVRVKMGLRLGYKDMIMERDLETLVRVRNGVCKRCSRQAGNYYEAIVQVRRTRSGLDKEGVIRVRHIVETKTNKMKKTNRDMYISKEVEVHSGIDFYIGHNEGARSLSKDLVNILGGTFTESASLAGQHDGRDFYRMTYLVRLPIFKPDDLIELEDEPCLVEAISGSNTRILELRTHKKTHYKIKEVENALKIGGPEDIQEATIVFEEADELQILDPVTMNTVTLRKPKGFITTGQVVFVFKTLDSLFLVPYPNEPAKKSE